MTAFRTTEDPARQMALAMGDLTDNARIRTYIRNRAFRAIIAEAVRSADATARLDAALRETA